jgi:hypothetical protein
MGSTAATLLSLVLAAAPAHGRTAQDQFRAALARTCPVKHLDRLAPADLLGDVEGFPRSLPPSLHRRLTRGATAAMARCAHVDGTACADAVWLDAIARQRLIGRFAARVCSAHLSCRGGGDCD